MSYYNQNQPPVGVPPPQGYPPEGYGKDGYPPQGYPAQGYPPQGYPPQGYPPQYPQQQQSSHSNSGLLQGWYAHDPVPYIFVFKLFFCDNLLFSCACLFVRLAWIVWVDSDLKYI